PREPVDAGLRRRIRDVRPADARADAADRRDVHDRARTLPLHVRQHLLAGEEHRFEIHAEDAVPGLLSRLDRTASATRDAGVVVEDVDPPELADARCGHRFAVRRAGHIPAERHRGPALALDLALR